MTAARYWYLHGRATGGDKKIGGSDDNFIKMAFYNTCIRSFTFGVSFNSGKLKCDFCCVA